MINQTDIKILKKSIRDLINDRLRYSIIFINPLPIKRLIWENIGVNIKTSIRENSVRNTIKWNTWDSFRRNLRIIIMPLYYRR